MMITILTSRVNKKVQTVLVFLKTNGMNGYNNKDWEIIGDDVMDGDDFRSIPSDDGDSGDVGRKSHPTFNPHSGLTRNQT